MAVAKLILRSEGIPFITKSEGVQDLFGLGRLFGLHNLITGPVQLEVREQDAMLALEALNAPPEPP